MNDDQEQAPWMQAPVTPNTFDITCSDMSDALECLHRRLESLSARLKPVTRLPAPLAPMTQVGQQPMPPKPFDPSSPLVSSVRAWERNINALSDKIAAIADSLDI